MNTSKRQGFSLVELMVVVAIIGILASIGIQKWREYRSQSRDSVRKTTLTQLSKALEIYHAQHESYPSTGGKWWSYSSTYGSKALTGSGGYIPDLAPQYVDKLPLDPLYENACANCGYLYRSDGVGFKLMSHGVTDRANSVGAVEIVPAAGEPFVDPVRSNYAIMVCEGATACAW